MAFLLGLPGVGMVLNSHRMGPFRAAQLGGHVSVQLLLKQATVLRKAAEVGRAREIFAFLTGADGLRAPAAAEGGCSKEATPLALAWTQIGPPWRECRVTPQHWLPSLGPAPRRELRALVNGAVDSMRSCYAAMYAPADRPAPAPAPAPAPGPAHARLALWDVFHDGHRHLQRLVVQFLVPRNPAVRRQLRCLARELTELKEGALVVN